MAFQGEANLVRCHYGFTAPRAPFASIRKHQIFSPKMDDNRGFSMILIQTALIFASWPNKNPWTWNGVLMFPESNLALEDRKTPLCDITLADTLVYVHGIRAFWAIGPGNRIGVTFEYNLLDLATRSPWSPAEAIRLHRSLAEKLEHFQVCPSTFLLDPFLDGWSGSRAFAFQKHKLSYQFLGWKTLTFKPIVEREEFWLRWSSQNKNKKGTQKSGKI